MNPAELIAAISKLGGKLYLENDDLRLKSPKGALSNELISELKEQKPALIAFLRTAQSASTKATVTIRRTDNNGTAPASFAQQRLWFLNELEEGQATYNIPSSMRLRGALNLAAMQTAVNNLVARHESLRTRFTVKDANPQQQIDPERHIAIDITESDGASKEAVERWLAGKTSIPFSLETGPLLRVHILRSAADEHHLLLVMHHIISDAWSISIACQELATFYAAACRGEPARLPTLPIQYIDYSIWQRQWLQGPELERQTAYWRDALASAPPLLELPTDKPRPNVQTYAGDRIKMAVDTELHQQLLSLTQRHGVSLFMLLQAALNVLLARYSGTEDIVIGTPVAGRQHAELEPLIGFFLNTIVLRTDVSGNPTFKELLDRVRKTTLAAFDHQDLPFEKLVEELRPDRELSHSPIFQVMFNLRMQTNNQFAMHELDVEFEAVERTTAKVDLTMSANESTNALNIELEYNTDLFSQKSIEKFARCFIRLLEDIVSDPQRRVGELTIISDADLQQQLAAEANAHPTNSFIEFPDSALEYSIADRFAAIAEQHADAIAVCADGINWSYAELNAKANAVAHELLRHGDSGARVGLLVGQNAPMLAGMLGILKAGMTYVPLDPEAPPARHAQICNEAALELIVTDGAHIAAAQSIERQNLFILEADSSDLATAGNPAIAVSPDSLAYILFTSGSTGTPKGVMQTHRNVLHHCRTYTNAIRIDTSDRLTLLPPYGFDAAVMDIFGALLNGASICPYDIRKQATPESINASISAKKITIFHSTPTVFRLLFDNRNDARTDSVRIVVMGGEETRLSDFQLFQKIFAADSIFVNGLGPSESTLTLQHFIRNGTRISGSVIPVGKPVAETEVVLLDEHGKPNSICGELAIRSEFVTTGYWNAPELTVAAFIDYDGSGKPAYRTGDHARFLPDGNLLFTGRRDAQVKLRGHRIEIGDIESTLKKHPAVKSCVVVLHAVGTNAPQLAAYYVLEAQKYLDTDDLRSFVREKLPHYMVPATYTLLSSIPLTANGKIDRNALPTPDANQLKNTAGEAPSTPDELALAAIWEQFLNVKEISLDDNFFNLGGHSLLLIRLLQEINQASGAELTIADLFENPTIRELTPLLRDATWATTEKQAGFSWKSLFKKRNAGKALK